MFSAQCYGDVVGALTERPRGKIFRIRIGFRQIRNILPLRAWCSAQRIKTGRLYRKGISSLCSVTVASAPKFIRRHGASRDG